MRYRKRIKIAKGISLNLSKSGISTSIGPRGASLTMGRRGSYLNTGIPGTGLYDRKKISNFGKRSGNRTRNATSSNATNSILSSVNVKISLDERGKPVLSLTDLDGYPIKDKTTIRKVKQQPQYKENLKHLTDRKKKDMETMLKGLTEVYKHTPPMLQATTIKSNLQKLEPKQYKPEDFPIKKPTIEKVKKRLRKEARKDINRLLFWKNKSERKAYVKENLDKRFQKALAKWTAKKEAFNKEQQQKAEAKNKEFQKDFKKKKQQLEGFLTGAETFVHQEMTKLLDQITLPMSFSMDYDYNAEKEELHIDLDLPELKEIPEKKVTTLSSGKISIKPKTQKEIKHQYALCVCGMAFYLSGLFFNVSEKINLVQISGYTQRINKSNGHEEDVYLYSVKMNRPVFTALNINRIDPITAFSNFDQRINITKTYIMKAIEPFEMEK